MGLGVVGGARIVGLLDEPRYRTFLARTHPELRMDDERLGVPSFIAPLDIREPLRPGFPKDLLEAMKELTPSLVAPRAVFIGTPFERYDQTHLLEEISNPVALIEKARAVARQERLHAVVLTNVSPTHPNLSEWLRAGFTALPSFPDAVVDLDCACFASHLARIPAEDRSGVRRNIRRFQDAGHRLERLEASSCHAELLFAAYWPFFSRANVRWQPHTRAYFEGLGELDARVRLTVARNALGTIIGFIVNFKDERGFQAGRVGVHPEWHRRDAVYFRLLYHVIEEALADPARSPADLLSLEPTSYRMKRHLGARRVPMVNLVFGVSAAWSMLLRRFDRLGRWLLAHLEDSVLIERDY